MLKPIFLALMLAAAAAAHAQPRLYLVTEHAPPGSMLVGDQVGGFITDRVRDILKRTGIDYSIELLPWKRAYTAALQRSDACVYATTRTPEREGLFKWVGPLMQADWVLMGRAGHHYNLRTLDDARGLRIGTYNGDVRDDYLRARGFNVDPAPNDLVNPPKLLAGRIDLWAASLRPDSRVLEQNGWAGKVVPVLVFKRVKVYLACNRALPDALIARMNGAVAQREAEGRGAEPSSGAASGPPAAPR